MKKIKYLLSLLLLALLFPQGDVAEQPTFSDFQISSERYLNDEKGNIMMYVNVWGHVGSPGHHLVYEGIDLATLMSVVGGPNKGANMKKVRVFREIPEEDGTLVYYLDFENFVSSGDRSEFIRIKPNDTIIIPEKISNYILTQVGTLNTFLSLFNLYFQLTN
jgi:hypothetical protein